MSTSQELQDALDVAEDNWTNDYIHLVQGTYQGIFSFTSYQHWEIVLRGGYTPNCASRVDDPSNTILDAQGAFGSTVLGLYQRAGGGVHVEGVTIRNGRYWGLWVRLINDFNDPHVEGINLVHNIIEGTRGRGGVLMMSEPGEAGADPIEVNDNVIVGNFGDRVGGLEILAAWRALASLIVLRDNLVVGNMHTEGPGGVQINLLGEGSVQLVNNTIVRNRTLSQHVTDPGGLRVSVGERFYAYNNIVQHNLAVLAPDDIYLYYSDPASGSGEGFHNNYSEMGGSWTAAGGNIDVDPGFVAPGHWNDNGTTSDPTDDYWVDGDYHLAPTSACIDAGSDDVPYPGSVNSKDFEGDPRIVDGDGDGTPAVDIGADEHVPAVVRECADGLDNDGDGYLDFAGGDPGCADSEDLSENDPTLPCDDGADNDGDGRMDFDPVTFAIPGDANTPPLGSGDPGCHDPSWGTESPQCQDGVNNDAGQDAKIDYDAGYSATGSPNPVGPDPDCAGKPWRNNERPSCGMGAELALLLPPLIWIYARRRARIRPRAFRRSLPGPAAG